MAHRPEVILAPERPAVPAVEIAANDPARPMEVPAAAPTAPPALALIVSLLGFMFFILTW